MVAGSTPSIWSREPFLYVSTTSGSSRSTQSALACSPRDRSTEMIPALWMYMRTFPRLRRVDYGTDRGDADTELGPVAVGWVAPMATSARSRLSTATVSG